MTVLLFAGLVTPLLLATWYSLFLQRDALNNAYQFEIASKADILADGMRRPIWNLLPQDGEALVRAVMEDKSVISVTVISLAQEEFLHQARELPDGVETRMLYRDVVFNGEKVGEVQLVVRASEHESVGAAARNRILLVGGLQILLSVAVVSIVGSLLIRREREHILQQTNAELQSKVEELRHAEQALRESEARFRSIVDHSPNLLLLKDTEGHIRVANKSYEKWSGLSSEEIIGYTVDQISERYPLEFPSRDDSAVIRERRPILDEIAISGPSGKKFQMRVTKFPVFQSDGEISGIAELGVDMTSQRRIEERLRQSQKLEVIGQLTGGVAHDFNNLLAVILGNAELMQENINAYISDMRGTAQNDTVKKLNSLLSRVGEIDSATRRGSNLTQQLLAYSRKQSLRPQVVAPGDLVKNMSTLLARTLGETISIRIFISTDLWAITIDAHQLENALLNLALNSRDAMPDGGTLTIECFNEHLDDAYVEQTPESLPGDHVVIQVTDEGHGMTPEVKSRAFEPFFTTKGVGKGSGLGLSMVYGFAKQSGGHVAIYSEEGGGTTVRFYLPRSDSEASRKNDDPLRDVPQGGGETILIVEDDANVRAIAVEMIRRLGYKTIDVEDALAARSVLEAGTHVDLMLTDVVLPDGPSGPEFAEAARREWPKIAVIFMSGYPAEAARRNGFPGSDNVLLNKPFRKLELAQALRERLDRTWG